MINNLNKNKYSKPPLSVGQSLLFENYFGLNLENKEVRSLCYIYFLFVLSNEYKSIPPIFGEPEKKWLNEEKNGLPTFQRLIASLGKLFSLSFCPDFGIDNIMFEFIASNRVNYYYLLQFSSLETIYSNYRKNIFTITEKYKAVQYVPQFLHDIYDNRHDLKDFFSTLPNEFGALIEWWRQAGFEEFCGSHGRNNTFDASKDPTTNEMHIEKGINIVGFINYELGIGEDARLACKALGSHTHICATEPKFNIPSPMIPESDRWKTSSTPKYDTNIIYMPANEHLSLALKTYDSFFKNRFSICNWQWELPLWPKALRPCLGLANEIWAPTTYIQNAINSVGSSQAIFMPMPVHISSFTQYDRRYFNLPLNNFIFLFVFDSLSWPQRKNPYACIEAFKAAFGSSPNVSLVIKTMNLKSSNFFYSYIMDSCMNDSRIFFYNKAFTRSEILSLFTVCDAYVSLHRAEGFGRTIAEAMLLGIPTIVSNFSGNCDFCNAENSYLVDGNIINLRRGDYIYHKNQFWFDASIDDAANKMKLCYSDKKARMQKIEHAKKIISENYSLSHVSQSYIKRLKFIGRI